MASRGKLTKDSIVAAALDMLDQGGEKAFSMRKLATVLNVDPMAIYHHHANKSALLQAVMQTMMDRCEVPARSGNWQTDIRALCAGLRRLALAHPGAFRIYETYEDWIPAEHRLNEAFHATLIDAGFSPQSAVRATRVLLAYSEAFAVDEISGWLDPGDQSALMESLKDGPYPVMRSLIDELSASDPDADFEFGLNILLNGLHAELQQTTDP